MRVFVTGIGVVSALGNNVQENLSSLLESKTGVSKKAYALLNRSIFTGTVGASNEELSILGKCNSKLSRTSLLGIVAAKECWGDNTFSEDIRTGFISGTSVGGMDRSETYFRDEIANRQSDISDLFYHDSGDTTTKIAKELVNF